MYKTKKWLPISLLATILLALVIGKVISFNKLLDWINTSFELGLAFLMLATWFYVLNSGFFTTFQRGLNRLKRVFFRKPRLILEQESISKPTKGFIYIPLYLGAYFIVFSIILMIFYYY